MGRLLEVRRVPERFIPPGALSAPEHVAGRVPVATIPAGGYVLANQLRDGARGRGRAPDPVRAGTSAVEIEVSGAAALASGSAGRLVDVVVTTEPGPRGGPGRTYVAAEAVPLLELRPASGEGPGAVPGATETWFATLALSRSQALRLIHAESFSRSVRLIARG